MAGYCDMNFYGTLYDGSSLEKVVENVIKKWKFLIQYKEEISFLMVITQRRLQTFVIYLVLKLYK